MNYKIPLFDLNFNKREEKAAVKTIRSGWISTGPRVEEFEKRFSEMTGSRYALATSNCTVALHLSMILSGICSGNEVICPSLTFVATVNSIRYVGAKPVFCDIISHENLNIDPEKIESKITSRTKAIVVMHYAGFPCNMKLIMNVAKKYNLKVIEDSCHALTSDYNGKKLGSIGDIGCFSFFSNKNVSTGEGGMLITNIKKYYEKAKLLRSHGMTTLSYERAQGHAVKYDVLELGYNYRMDDIRAAIGIEQLNKLGKNLVRREYIRNKYLDLMGEIDEIIIPFRGNMNKVSNYIFPVVLKKGISGKRDIIRHILKNNGIQTSVHYDPPVHKMKIYLSNIQLPLTDYVSKSLISLPMYPNLNNGQIRFIVNKFKDAITKIK